MDRSSKLIILAIEAVFSAAIWWSVQSDQERAAIRAAGWQTIQKTAQRIAVRAGTVALAAEKKYYQEVSA